MTERGELAELLQDSITDSLPSNPYKTEIRDQVDTAVDILIAAGYRKPQQVTTVEEVAALPVDSVLAGRPLRLDSSVGNIFCVADPELEEQAGLYVMGVDGVQSFEFIFDDLPATVLHLGGAE